MHSNIPALGKSLLDGVRSLPAYLAFWGSAPPNPAVLEERRHVYALRQSLCTPTLRPIEAKAVEALDNHGIFVTHLRELNLACAGGDAIMSEGQCLVEDLIARNPASACELPTLTISTPKHIMRYPKLYRWGLNAVFLRIVEQYLRQSVGFDGYHIFHTRPDIGECSTRRWHRDREDERMVKICIYLNDVDNNGGPFELFPVKPKPINTYNKYKTYNSNEMKLLFEPHFEQNQIVTCQGHRGTIIFADTAAYFHRARPVMTTPRSAIFYSYFSRTPHNPYFCNRSELSNQEIALLIQGLHPAQKACATWRENLSLLSRWLPPSRF